MFGTTVKRKLVESYDQLFLNMDGMLYIFYDNYVSEILSMGETVVLSNEEEFEEEFSEIINIINVEIPKIGMVTDESVEDAKEIFNSCDLIKTLPGFSELFVFFEQQNWKPKTPTFFGPIISFLKDSTIESVFDMFGAVSDSTNSEISISVEIVKYDFQLSQINKFHEVLHRFRALEDALIEMGVETADYSLELHNILSDLRISSTSGFIDITQLLDDAFDHNLMPPEDIEEAIARIRRTIQVMRIGINNTNNIITRLSNNPNMNFMGFAP